MNNPPFDVPKAQHSFAVELNNLAWDFVEMASLDPAQTERMIHAAHAACHFWLQSGNLLNHLRAQNLLATAYARAGRGEPAVYHAERCLALSAEAGNTQTPFDRAVALGCAALAYKVSGNSTKAAEYRGLASLAAGKLSETDDKSVFDRFYGGA